jgi:ABC-2 type transport system permease protein
MLVWLPMLLSVVVVLVFYEGRLVGLPVGVVDQAGSSLSRELLRRVEALPSVAGIPFSDLGEADQAMRRGEIYGFLVIPPDLDARIATMEPVAVSAFINGQMLVVSNAIETDLNLAVQSLSRELLYSRETQKGRSGLIAEARVSPIQNQRSSLGNPGMDYLPFLAGTAIPCVLQIVILLTGIWVVGLEFRHASASRWWRLSGGNPWIALSAKIVPVLLLGCFWGWGWLSWMHASWLPEGWGLRWPIATHYGWILLGWVFLVWAASGLGVGLVVLTANLRLSLSAAAFLAAPAMAFVGVTFPHFAMVGFARGWSQIIPVTHFLMLQEAVIYKGAVPVLPFFVLGMIGFLGWLIAGLLLRSRCIDQRYWNKT